MSDTPATAALRPAAPTPRALVEVLPAVPSLHLTGSAAGVLITGCTHDSRAVQPGDLYAALPGAHSHGADFVAAAIAAGAVAVLTDPAAAQGMSSAPVLVADDPRSVLGDVAAWVHGFPARDLLMLGVTGTNGKTTTAFLLEAGLRAAGRSTGLLGTVSTRVGDDELPKTWITNPEATDLQAVLALMRERGVDAVAMEVSSHALTLGRVDGVRFDVAAFTNLSQDHLEFHATMAEYERAKASLFTARRCRHAVVNCADAAGRRILQSIEVPFATFGEDGEWQARAVDLRPDGSDFRLVGPHGEHRASVQLPGAFNVDNAICAIATLVTAGISVEDAVRGVASAPGVPGRMEKVDAGQPFLAIVDYAHTPDAVSTLLSALRRVTSGRLIVVLGCGGDRDRSKRPLMAQAAASGADMVVLTSDNPRSEDPLDILAQMRSGAPDAVVEADRRTAIALAVAQARPGDAVVVAGKGHETGQESGGVVTPFDDRVVLREAVSSWSP